MNKDRVRLEFTPGESEQHHYFYALTGHKLNSYKLSGVILEAEDVGKRERIYVSPLLILHIFAND